jgi:hypothetical protein
LIHDDGCDADLEEDALEAEPSNALRNRSFGEFDERLVCLVVEHARSRDDFFCVIHDRKELPSFDGRLELAGWSREKEPIRIALIKGEQPIGVFAFRRSQRQASSLHVALLQTELSTN